MSGRPPTTRPGPRPRGGWRFALLCLALAAAGRLEAQPTTNSFDAAIRLFQASAFDLAEKELGAFIAAYPQADKAPEARLFQAQCRLRLGDSEGALSLLRTGPGPAVGLADEYAYWLAESLFQKGDTAEAARAFGAMLSEHPTSPRRLDAGLGEAHAYYKLGDLRRSVDLLRDPKGHFQQAAEARPGDELAGRGWLLLAEAALALQDLPAAQGALDRLADLKSPGELAGQRDLLRARTQWGLRQAEAALTTLTNLLTQANAATNRTALRLRADARGLQAEILEQQGQRDAAIQAYDQNLGPDVPPARREEALRGIVRLALAGGKLAEAAARVEIYLQENPAEPGVEAARLTLGDLRLQQFYATPAPERVGASNLLASARQQFSLVLSNASSLSAPTALLHRGWAAWEAGQLSGASNLLAEATADFRQAAERLPVSEAQAVARFKLADGLFALGRTAEAASNYWGVVTNYAALPAVSQGLGPQALYQVLRASIGLGDLVGGNEALRTLLERHPDSSFGDGGVLVFGQAVSRSGRPAEARQVFEQFEQRFPDSALLPEVGLAVARTYQQETNWPGAAAAYERWLGRFTNHTARPKALFERAWTDYRAGHETNALAGFRTVVAQFPNDPLAPWAQHWIGDYHYRGERYDLAEFDYQIIFQNTNWAVPDLKQHARLMAGRSAFSRQDYNAARGYFTNLIADPRASTGLLPEAWFELGNTLMADKPAGTTNALSHYQDARVAFSRIPQNFPDSRFVPLAWGQIGNCDLQLGGTDPKRYDDAIEAFGHALNAERADVSTRSMAAVGLGTTLEKKARDEKASALERSAWNDEALSRYLSVVTADLRPNETADPFWVAKAAQEAARLAELQQRWELAANLYQQLKELAPALRDTWQARLDRVNPLREGARPDPP